MEQRDAQPGHQPGQPLVEDPRPAVVSHGACEVAHPLGGPGGVAECVGPHEADRLHRDGRRRSGIEPRPRVDLGWSAEHIERFAHHRTVVDLAIRVVEPPLAESVERSVENVGGCRHDRSLSKYDVRGFDAHDTHPRRGQDAGEQAPRRTIQVCLSMNAVLVKAFLYRTSYGV